MDMTTRPRLHVAFTMDCRPVANGRARDRPPTWELSSRSIEGYANAVLHAGFLPTLFLSPECADQHGPMLEELADRGAELALLVDPRTMLSTSYKHPLGKFKEDEQRQIIETCTEQVRGALGVRPRSFRSGGFSANDSTFKAAYDVGFRQGSISCPGRNIGKDIANWSGAPLDAGYVDPDNRHATGTLPFLNLPITTDETQRYSRGIPFEMCLENGNVEAYHKPIIEHTLNRRLGGQGAGFLALCCYTLNTNFYFDPENVHRCTLEDLLDYLEVLSRDYDVTPVTLVSAHAQFISMQAARTT